MSAISAARGTLPTGFTQLGVPALLLALASTARGQHEPASRRSEPAGSRQCLSIQQAKQEPKNQGFYLVMGSSTCAGPVRVQLLERAIGSRVWRTLASTPALVTRGGKWTVSAPRDIGLPEGREIIALGAAGSPESGFRDTDRLLEGTEGHSAPFALPSSPHGELEARPRVRINRVDGRDASSDPLLEYDVGLQARVEGSVHRSGSANVQCVVQPASSEGRWLMRSGTSSDGSFDCMAHFGDAENFLEFEHFLLYAVVTSPRIPPVREYHPEEWERAITSGQVQAVSSVIHVRRTIRPTKVDDASVAIRHLGDEAVGGGTLNVRPLSAVDGDVGGPGLSSHKVAVFVRPDKPDGRWKSVGTGLSSDGKYWSLLPTFLGETNEQILLIAVRYQGRLPDLNNPVDTHWIVAQSPLVRALIVEPPLEISRVCSRGVGAQAGAKKDAALQVGTTCRLEGNRFTGSRAESVALYERAESGTPRWHRIGLVEGVTGSRWGTGELSLGAKGRCVLVAVSGFQRAEENELPMGNELRMSNVVHVQIEEDQ